MQFDFLTDTDARLKTFKNNNLSMKDLKEWAEKDTVNTHFYKLIAFEMEVLKNIYMKTRFNATSLNLRRIFPYGYVINEKECYVKIPKEYEWIGNDKLAFYLSVIPSNRNIWHLLSLNDKYEFYDFISTHQGYTLKHMVSPYYTCGDLADGILRFTIGESLSIFTEYYQDRKNNKRIINDQYNDRFMEIPTDHMLQDSLLPFEICKFENFLINYEGKEHKFYKYSKIDVWKEPRVHVGQYIATLECR